MCCAHVGRRSPFAERCEQSWLFTSADSADCAPRTTPIVGAIKFHPDIRALPPGSFRRGRRCTYMVADKPVADKPVADKPVADKPVADKP